MDPELSFSTPKVTQVTSNSITFTWDWKITGLSKDRVHFQVTARGEFPDGGYYKRIDAPDGNACTFPDLKDDTEYSFCIIAFDDEDQELGQYPDYDAEVTLTVKTKVLDEDAPTVSSRELKVSAPNPEGFTVTWTRAKDKVTAAKNILYEFWLKEIGGAQDAKLFKKGKYLSSAKVTGLKTATKYEFYVLAIDEAGNSLRYPSDDGFETAETVDDVAPSVGDDAITVTGRTQDSISIKWNQATDNVTEHAKIHYQVWWTMDNGQPDPWHFCRVGDGVCSYKISDLRDSTPYSIYVKAIDEAGNELKYQNLLVTTKDKTAPQTNSSSVSVIDKTIDSISLKWNLAQDNTTAKEKIKYEIWWKRNDSTDKWHSATAGAGISSYRISGLEEGVQYAYYIKAIDEAGNEAKFLDNGDFFYASTKDKTAPKVDSESVTVTETTSDSISLKWNQATDNVTTQAKIRYEVWWTKCNDAQDSWHFASVRAGVSSYRITELKDSTRYAYYIKAIDEAGNEAKFLKNGGFFYVSTKDKTAPKGDTNSITVTGTTSNSVSIKWNQATDNVTAQAKISYTVLWSKNNDPQDSWHSASAGAGVSSYKITGLKDSTLYAIFVKAIDESGNTFSYSVKLATTQSLDTSKPSVGNSTLTVTYLDMNSFTVRWNPASDNKTTQDKIVYKVYLLPPMGSPNRNWNKVKEAPNFYSHTFTDLKSGSTYSCYVVARDEAGNELQYSNLTVDTPTRNCWARGGDVKCITYNDTPAFQLNLGTKFNRYRFDISIDFTYYDITNLMSFARKTSSKKTKKITILSLDSIKNTLCLYLSLTNDVKKICLAINNGKQTLDTGIICKNMERQSFVLKYRKGSLSINGKSFSIGELDSIYGGNNLLSSQDFNDRTFFTGIINSVEVISY